MVGDMSDMPELIPPGPKLTLKHKAPEVAPPVERHRAEAMKKVPRRQRRKRVRKASSFWMGSVGSFLIAALILGGLLYHQFSKRELITLEQFHFARVILVSAMFVVLVIDGFVQDMLQGVIGLFFPPYAWVYGLLFADNGPIRGLTAATLLFLGAEIWVTPKDSLVLQLQETVNTWIDKGQKSLTDPYKK